MELPAAHAGVEDRAGAGYGQHRRAQAGRDHAPDRAAIRRGMPAGRPAAGRGQHPHRSRRHRRGAVVEHPDVDKVAFTGSTEVGKLIARAVAGTAQEGHPRARRQGGEHRVRRRPDRPVGRGHRQRHLLQPGARLLRRNPAAGAGVGGRGGAGLAEAAGEHAAGRRPAGQEHRHRRDQLRGPAGEDQRAVRRSARRRAPAAGHRPCEIPERGYWFPPTVFTGVEPVASDRPRGDLRSGAFGADLPHPGGGGREGEQHAVRAVRRRLDREGQPHPLDGGPAARRRGVGQHVQPVRPVVAVRRVQGVRLRPRGRAARPGRIPEDLGPD